MEQRNSKNQYLNLGAIVIEKTVISAMETDSKFHNFIYNCLMLHETGECETVANAHDSNNPENGSNQIIKSSHTYKSSGEKIDILTTLNKGQTAVVWQ
jgi:hypothetical protein